jgi:UPF0113 PUA domain
VIILNQKQEAIAIGKTRFGDNLLLQNSKIAVTTMTDAGLYLRSEGNKRKKSE